MLRMHAGNGKHHHDVEQKPSYQFTSLPPPSLSKPLQGSSRHNANFHQTGNCAIHDCIHCTMLMCRDNI